MYVQIENIKGMLPNLSKNAVNEVKDFVEFLIEKQQKRDNFVKETLNVEANSDIVTFDSAKKAVKTIKNWEE